MAIGVVVTDGMDLQHVIRVSMPVVIRTIIVLDMQQQVLMDEELQLLAIVIVVTIMSVAFAKATLVMVEQSEIRRDVWLQLRMVHHQSVHNVRPYVIVMVKV